VHRLHTLFSIGYLADGVQAGADERLHAGNRRVTEAGSTTRGSGRNQVTFLPPGVHVDTSFVVSTASMCRLLHMAPLMPPPVGQARTGQHRLVRCALVLAQPAGGVAKWCQSGWVLTGTVGAEAAPSSLLQWMWADRELGLGPSGA
jgi:hypothetical protein